MTGQENDKKDSYVKFNATCELGSPISDSELEILNKWRDKMYEEGLIGAYPDHTGFGNISIRCTGPQKGFIISGSKTGSILHLEKIHFDMVISYDLKENRVVYTHQSKPFSDSHFVASSESMTHASIYDSDPDVKAVIHGHNLKFWQYLLDRKDIPTTKETAQYGTPEMAKEIKRLFLETDVKQKKIVVMAGHEEGVISFGKDLDEAGKIMLQYLNLSTK